MNDRELKINNIKHNIDVQILSIYKNFITVVYNYVVSTYVEDALMTEEKNIEHFKFCWLKASEDFKITEIPFQEMVKAKEYFQRLVLRLFYSSKLKDFSNGENCNRIFNETINVLFEFKPTYSDQMIIINNIYKLFKINE